MTRAASAATVILLAACLFSATAGEIVKFKNGHQMVVRKSEIDGDTIILTLEDGSVLGFPKNLVSIEGNTRVKYTPPAVANRVSRGPSSADLRARHSGDGQKMLASQTISANELDGRSLMSGYNRPGAGRVSATELAPKTPRQKAGTSFKAARQAQQGERTRAPKPGQDPNLIPQPDVPKIRPVFADDKKSAASPK